MRVLCVALLLCSCAVYKHKAVSANGNMEEDLYGTFGGSASMKGADGSSFVHDHNASFQNFMQTAGMVAGGAISAAAEKANNASDNALSASQAQTAARLSAAKAAIAKTPAPITVTPPNTVVVPPIPKVNPP